VVLTGKSGVNAYFDRLLLLIVMVVVVFWRQVVKIVHVGPQVLELDACAVAVQVYHGPQGCPCVHPGEEDAQILAVEAKVDVPVCQDRVVDSCVHGGDTALGKGLGPEPVLLGQVRAGILGQRGAKAGGVMGRKTHSEDSIPPVTELCELYADPFAHHDWPVTEDNALAEALGSYGLRFVRRQDDVVAVLEVKPKWGQVVVGSRGR